MKKNKKCVDHDARLDRMKPGKYKDGYFAGLWGLSAVECRYEDGSKDASLWYRGYKAATCRKKGRA